MPAMAKGRFAAAVAFVGVATTATTGCGDGAGAQTSISADPGSLAFVIDKGAAEQSQSQPLTIHFIGDGVVAGYAPGVMAPDWLSIEDAALATIDSASFILTAAAAFMRAGAQVTYSLGSHDSVSMRFATGRLPANGDIRQATEIVYVDVPVMFSVVGFQALPASVSLVGQFNGATPPPTVFSSFQLDGSLPAPAPGAPFTPLAWTATSDQPWLTLMPSSGATPAIVYLTADTAGFSAGEYQATITVTGGDLIPLKVPVTLTLTAP